MTKQTKAQKAKKAKSVSERQRDFRERKKAQGFSSKTLLLSDKALSIAKNVQDGYSLSDTIDFIILQFEKNPEYQKLGFPEYAPPKKNPDNSDLF